MSPWKKLIVGAIAVSLGMVPGAAFSQDPLRSGFENPPNGARPRVWWHWMNGNITEEGIQLDLEWMHRVGLGGFQNFDAALFTPPVVPHRLAYMTPEWKQAFVFATKTADRLGLEEAIAGSPGWSETGGPWVPSSESMKKYVWSETEIEGGRPFIGKLAHPPGNTGAFQDLGIEDVGALMGGGPKFPDFYADSAVIAYRVPDNETAPAQAKLTASGGNPDFALLSDGSLNKTTQLPIATEGQSAWIQWEFSRPQMIRGFTVALGGKNPLDAFAPPGGDTGQTLQASDDGQNFRTIAGNTKGGSTEHTITFEPVTAKYFRYSFKTLPPATGGLADLDLGFPKMPPPTNYEIYELKLHTGTRVNRFEEKAAFNPLPDLYGFATPDVPAADAIQKSSVVDLTAKMRSDGTLDWTPPAGKWVVLRFGYSPLGITNHPATEEATGLEVDKLNGAYVRKYMDHYLDSYKDTVGPGLMGEHGIRYVVTDSWEAGAQNWTDNMIAEFSKRRGYDPRPWMPVLAGRVVESSQASDAFLWDLRKTIADLTAEEHYGQVEAAIHAHGMGHYGESHESGRAFIADGMEVKKLNEVPMSAMWTQVPGVNREQYGYNADDRESASVAHIYGQNIAAAESMTAMAAPWAWSPATLKPTADKELAEGINRFVIHTSVHQPLVDKKPGLGLGPFGQWFNRNETWAEQAGPWVTYLARSSYLLQQGHFGADILYFYGEDSNVTAIFADKSPDVPEGYGFDYVNADALEHEVKVKAGLLTTPSGMSYRLLALDPYSRHMSLPVLRSIEALVKQGAIVVGPKPLATPSLGDSAQEFQRIADQLWNGKSIQPSLAEALPALKLEPDFRYSKPEADTSFLFVHRKLSDGDLYFVDNRTDREQKIDASFRVTGKAPELWHADSGVIEEASYNVFAGHTTVPLHLEPWGTVFVVFRKASKETQRTLPTMTETKLMTIDGPWKLAFQEGRGAPASTTLDQLTSWSDNTEAGVKYFSGIGTYTKTIEAPAAWFTPKAKLWLDLGDVKNLAEVSVNGKSLGVAWHPPYRVDLTDTLKPGANEVTIKVVNAWVNRLIGDQQPGATQYTFTVIHPYKANSPLLPSGLMGPVQVLAYGKQ